MKITESHLKISRILHAGYLFENSGTQIVFDPIFENPFSQNCYAFPNVQFDQEKIKKLKPDAVFISHFHDDHCSMESLNLLNRNTPIFVYCIFEELFDLIRKLGFLNVFSLKIDTPIQIGNFEITPRRALDCDVDSLFQIKVANLNILNVVDSWIDYETLDALQKYAPWDMILWPFQTMREIEVLIPSRSLASASELPEEWLQQLKVLNPKYLVPSSCQFIQESWSWYNHAFFPISYAQFENQIITVLPNTEVVRLNPSGSVCLDKKGLQKSTSLDWVIPIGSQDVDYEYKALLKPPSTAEISKEFNALNAEQVKRVLNYCQIEIVEKYKLLELSQDYFKKPRLWRLTLYDHTGVATHFYYHVKGDSLQLTHDDKEPLAWITEIPFSKLYEALENGESLTSLYMRINDMIFDTETENEIQSVDVMEDPLIRCLFSGVFGAYQKAQLQRLLKKL